MKATFVMWTSLTPFCLLCSRNCLKFYWMGIWRDPKKRLRLPWVFYVNWYIWIFIFLGMYCGPFSVFFLSYCISRESSWYIVQVWALIFSPSQTFMEKPNERKLRQSPGVVVGRVSSIWYTFLLVSALSWFFWLLFSNTVMVSIDAYQKRPIL